MAVPIDVTSRGGGMFSQLAVERQLAVHPKRVLIVDDNIAAAEMLSMLLALYGYEVEVAHSGREGLELARELVPSAVLLDIGLPDMSGYEVADQLRKVATLASTVIIAVSGTPPDKDARRDSNGFDYHLTKPVSFDELENLLNPERPGGVG
jgi:CheY-like chemotaxis protein